MKLKELKAIVANVDTENLRLAGFCDEYDKMPKKNQFKVIEQMQTICIFNMNFVDDLPVYGSSETKEQILSLSSDYDDYEVLLVGSEEANREPELKRIMKTRRLDDPTDPRSSGLCLLGPMYHKPYRVLMIFADTRKAIADEFKDNICVNEWGESCYSEEFDTEEELEQYVLRHKGIVDESVGDRIIYIFEKEGIIEPYYGSINVNK